MSDTGQKQSLNPRVEKVLQLLRQNLAVSIFLVAIMFVLACAKMVDASQTLWKIFQTPPEPRLTAVFLDQKQAQSNLTVNPLWKNHFGSGFSNPVSVVVALRNSGTAAATNVEVYLVYPPGVVNVQQSTGTKTPPAVLGDLKAVTGYETVETFRIARIDPSPITNAFEKELRLQFRFRQIFEVPVIRTHLPFMVPLHLDFASSESKIIGEFPITYVIKFSESEKPIAGTMMLRLDGSKNELLKRPDFNATIGLVRKDSPPALAAGKRTDVIDVHLLADDLAALSELVSSDCKKARPKLVVAKAFEERNSNDVWTTFLTDDGQKVVLVDRGDDGVLDQMFLQFANSEWWELAPNKQVPYVALSDLIDVSRDTCFAANLARKLGIKQP